jgi:CDP-glucose 4,6-dehydratase
MSAGMITPAFWRERRVFLTGHTGFKGAWLSIWLQQLGARVTGYALEPPTTPSLYALGKVDGLVTSHCADVRDAATLASALRTAAPEIVVHMAAQPLVRDSYKRPAETYAINVQGTVHLLEAVRACPGVRAVVIVTTDKCYENREWCWGYREHEPLGGYDPYSSSKACAELVTAAYRASFFNPAEHARHGVAVASARAGNVIGGGDWAEDRLVPDCLRAMLAGTPVVVRNPAAIRPWQHVLDPLSGYLLLAERLYAEGPAYAEGWNFGPHEDDAQPVSWLVEYLARQWGKPVQVDMAGAAGPHEAHYLKLDCSKAHTRLGWRPRWRLGTALEKTLEWTRVYARGEDVAAACRRQIAEYMAADA